MSMNQKARLLQAANADAANVFPPLSPEKAQALKDEAWEEFVKACTACEGDLAEHRRAYMQRVEEIENAAGFGD